MTLNLAGLISGVNSGVTDSFGSRSILHQRYPLYEPVVEQP
jgi:hypothetical protein